MAHKNEEDRFPSVLLEGFPRFPTEVRCDEMIGGVWWVDQREREQIFSHLVRYQTHLQKRLWRYGPSDTLIRADGCYAFRIEGEGFVDWVTFIARS